MKGLFFKLKIILRKIFINQLKLSRPASFPFITGDGLRFVAQHHFDELSDFYEGDVSMGDIIFVRSDFLINFF